MKGIIVLAVAMLCCMKMTESCTCVRPIIKTLCAADFVGTIYVNGDLIESKEGPYQRVAVVEAIKGSRDVVRVYLSTRKPGEPLNSCERTALEKYKEYLLSGAAYIYNVNGNRKIRALLLNGCDVVTQKDSDANDEKLPLALAKIITDKDSACEEEEPVSTD
ncbi:hypothetical protein ACF0H5_021958 [Mactra antiquata]